MEKFREKNENHIVHNTVEFLYNVYIISLQQSAIIYL